jgi:uncharacterized protein involved in cysteine biosynthesis
LLSNSTFVPASHQDQWLARAPANNAADRFWEGISAPWHGWRLLRQQPRLWALAALPTLLNLLISLLVAVAVIGGGYWLVTVLHDSFAGQFTGWGWYAALTGEVLLVLAIAPLVLIIAIVLWKIMTMIFCGYLFSRLAIEVERLIGLDERDLRPVSFTAEALGLIFSLLVLIFGSTVLIALVFIPVVGGFLSFVFGTLFTCWIMGLDYLGYPLALRGLPRWRQYPFGLANSSRAIGLGLFVSTCELIPILGAIPLTSAVIGAVLLQRKCRVGPAREAGAGPP